MPPASGVGGADLGRNGGGMVSPPNSASATHWGLVGRGPLHLISVIYVQRQAEDYHLVRRGPQFRAFCSG